MSALHEFHEDSYPKQKTYRPDGLGETLAAMPYRRIRGSRRWFNWAQIHDT